MSNSDRNLTDGTYNAIGNSGVVGTFPCGCSQSTVLRDVAQPADVAGVPELKPCPFCGKVPDGGLWKGSIGIWHTGTCRIAGMAFSSEQWNQRATQPATTLSDAIQRARAIRFPFPCGCLDHHSAKGMTVEEFTCETHRAIAAAIQCTPPDVTERARRATRKIINRLPYEVAQHVNRGLLEVIIAAEFERD